MKYNFILSGFTDEADNMLEGQIAAAQANGLRYIEIRGVNGKNIAELTHEEAKEIRKKLDEAGIRISALGSPAGKTDLHDDFTFESEQFKRLIDNAHVLGTQRLRMFSFYGAYEEHARDEVMARLLRFAEMAKGSDVVLCHENEKGIYGEKAPECLDICRSIPGMRAVFDGANFVQAKQDTIDAWKMLSPYVEYFHMKDALPDGRIVPIGMGVSNVEFLLKSFGKQGGGFLTLEPHLTQFVGLKKLELASNESKLGSIQFHSQREAFDYASDTLKSMLLKIEQED